MNKYGVWTWLLVLLASMIVGIGQLRLRLFAFGEAALGTLCTGRWFADRSVWRFWRRLTCLDPSGIRSSKFCSHTLLR
jgi:hypothetical protein